MNDACNDFWRGTIFIFVVLFPGRHPAVLCCADISSEVRSVLESQPAQHDQNSITAGYHISGSLNPYQISEDPEFVRELI